MVCQTLPPLGTQPEAVEEGLAQLGYHCRWFEGATIAKLRELLLYDWPVIVFVYAADLHRGGSGLHAIVLVEMGERKVIALDPIAKRATQIDISAFETMWTNFGNQGMVIWL